MKKTFNRLAMAAMLASVAAFSVSAVDARPGGGKNSGSRGSQTNVAPPTTNTAPTAAQPMQRTVTPSQPAAQNAPRPGAPAAAPAAAPSMGRSLMMGSAPACSARACSACSRARASSPASARSPACSASCSSSR